MVQLNAKKGLAIVLLAMGVMLFTAKTAQAAYRDNRLGVFLDFPGKGAKVVGFIGNSPAARAGIQLGDIIEKVNAHKPNTAEGWQKLKLGAVVHVHIFRPSTKKKFEVKVGN